MSDDIEDSARHVLDEDGVIRDRFIEYIFIDVFEGEIDAVTIGNFNQLRTRLLPPELPPITMEICSDISAALSWAMNIGPVSVWNLSPEDAASVPGNKKEIKLLYGAKIGGYDIGAPVAGSTIVRTIILAAVQVLREISKGVQHRTHLDAVH